MKHKNITPLEGGLSSYDLDSLSAALAVLEYLRGQPTWRWWRRWIGRPVPLRNVGEKRRENGYSVFFGWYSFTCRHGQHEVSEGICREFRRVFGRDATLRDVHQ